LNAALLDARAAIAVAIAFAGATVLEMIRSPPATRKPIA